MTCVALKYQASLLEYRSTARLMTDIIYLVYYVGLCGDLPHSAVSFVYRKFEIDIPPIMAPDSGISPALITCSV